MTICELESTPSGGWVDVLTPQPIELGVWTLSVDVSLSIPDPLWVEQLRERLWYNLLEDSSAWDERTQVIREQFNQATTSEARKQRMEDFLVGHLKERGFRRYLEAWVGQYGITWPLWASAMRATTQLRSPFGGMIGYLTSKIVGTMTKIKDRWVISDWNGLYRHWQRYNKTLMPPEGIACIRTRKGKKI